LMLILLSIFNIASKQNKRLTPIIPLKDIQNQCQIAFS